MTYLAAKLFPNTGLYKNIASLWTVAAQHDSAIRTKSYFHTMNQSAGGMKSQETTDSTNNGLCETVVCVTLAVFLKHCKVTLKVELQMPD